MYSIIFRYYFYELRDFIKNSSVDIVRNTLCI